jgi:multisubunit Na+/H+ antiporter MnhF subunit
MPALLDIALALMVLAGAFFLGSVALALFKEIKGGNNDQNNTPGK